MKIICYEFQLNLDFSKEIWPFIQKNAKSIINVFIIERPSFFQRIKGNKQLTCSQIGELGSLTKEKIADIKYQSFYAGNMDVLYQIKDIEFIKQMLRDDFSAGQIVKEYEDIPTEKEKVILIEKIVLENKDSLFFAFGHDADVLYLFGTDNNLSLNYEFHQDQSS
ncbi:MAG: hypothetical protein K6U80_19550 [Firmicutes bacterium]|nr:hypothetical protein [Bacillota bacterium]